MDWLERNLERRTNLPQIIAERAQATPDEVMAYQIDGPEWTYARFHQRVLDWAAALRRQGVKAGDHVLTFTEAHFDAYALWLGLAWLGAVEVPINPAYRGGILAHAIRMSDAKLAILSPTFLPRVREVFAEAPIIRTVMLLGEEPVEAADDAFHIVREADAFADLPALDPATLVEPQPHHIACIIFTSGTTGPSKAVLVPWGQLIASAYLGRADKDNDDAFNMHAGSVFYGFFPAFHMSGRYALTNAVARAAKLAWRPVFSVEAFWTDVDKYRCTHALLLTPFMSFLMRKPAREDDPDHPLHAVVGGPAGPILDEFMARFGVRVRMGFGMTEIGGPLGTPWMDVARQSCGTVPVGAPGYEIRLVDEFDNPVPDGEPGELIVRTDEPWSLNAGYYKMPEETAKAWRNGWFHTGDMLRRDERGEYHFVDRAKDCIRRLGENISSFEVENYVVQNPMVREVAAVAYPSDYGNGEDEVKIFVVPKPDATPDAQALWTDLAARMPKFMTPRFIEFIEALPRTEATERIQKAKLKSLTNTEKTWDARKQEKAKEPA